MTLHTSFRFVTMTSCLGLSLAILPVTPDLQSGLRMPAAWAQEAISTEGAADDPAIPDAPQEDPGAVEDPEYVPEEMPELEAGDLPDEADIAPIVFDNEGEAYEEWLQRQNRRADQPMVPSDGSNGPKVTWEGALTMELKEDRVEFRDHVSGRRSHTVGLTAAEAKEFFDSLASVDPETARTKAGFSG